MRTLRFSLLLVAGCAAALLLRADHPANGDATQALLAGLPRAGAAGQVAPEVVRDALVSAGPRGLAMGLDLLNDSEAAVRAGVASYLGERKSRLAVPGLIKLLRDPEAAVRRAAALALGAAGDPQALPFLDRAMGERDPQVAEAAVRAARQIRAAGQPRPRPRSIMP